MTRPWLTVLRRFFAPLARRSTRKHANARRGASPVALVLERLEDRTLPATITWNIATGGSWHTPANWDLNRVPTTGDSIVIPDLADSQIITFSTGSLSVAGIQSGETLAVIGGTLTNTTSLTNSPTSSGVLSVQGGTFSATGTNWSNAGTIQLSGGTLNLGGSFTTAGIGTLTRTNGTAGTVNLTGILNNDGATLNLDTTNNGFGTWTLLGGRINNGTVATGGTGVFRLDTGTLDGVTFAANSNVLTNLNASVTVLNGLTVNGLITLGTQSQGPSDGLYFVGSQTLDGSGNIHIPSSGQSLWLNQANMTLTIGEDLTIHGSGGGTGSGIGVTSAAFNASVVNHGILRGDGSALFVVGRQADLSSTRLASFTNSPLGRLEASSGTFNIASTNWTNQGSLTFSGSTLNITSSTWTNTGSITHDAGTVNFGGTFSLADLATYSRQNGTAGAVNLTGTLNNSGTLNLDTVNNGYGTWTLDGGRINGGTVATGVGVQLRLSTGTLDDVTFATNSDMLTLINADVTVINGLTVNGLITLGTQTQGPSHGLYFVGSQILDGTGNIHIPSAGQSLWLDQANMTLTIGEDLTIHGSGGGTGSGIGTTTPATGASVINHGTLRNDGSALFVVG